MSSKSDEQLQWQELEILVNGGSLSVTHFAASDKVSNQQPIIVFHGNGMNGWCHRKLIEDYQGLHPIYLVDARGHGFSSSVNKNQIKNWDIFYDDAEVVLDFVNQRHKNTQPHMIAHSLGALVSIEMLNRGYKFASMTLIEPVLLKRWEVWGVGFCQAFDRLFKHRFKTVRKLNPKVKQALKRRNGWESREVLKSSYLKKSFFRAFDPQVLSDYLDRGVRDTDTGVELRCSPHFEAEVFHHLDTKILSRSSNTCPKTTIILGEKEGTTVSKQGRHVLTQRFPGAIIESMPDQGHFMPFNVPDEVKKFVPI